MSDVSGTKEVHDLLGYLLVSDCVSLLSMERQMALGLWSMQFCYGGYAKRMLALWLCKTIEIGSIGYHKC